MLPQEPEDFRARERRLTCFGTTEARCPLCGRNVDPDDPYGCVCTCPVHEDYFENCDCEREEYVE